jgi:hypothetical protein
VKCSPIISVSPTPPIAYEPRDLSALRSGKQNPWGSLNHHRRRPYAHPHVTNSRLEALNHSNLLPPHPRHSVSSVSSLRHSFNTQSNSYSHQPLAPVNIIQTIQHPHGISSTKPKITKTIPTTPEKFQKNTWTGRCACGNTIPAYSPDQRSWRTDTRDRRFQRRFCRLWDRKRGRSHVWGGHLW